MERAIRDGGRRAGVDRSRRRTSRRRARRPRPRAILRARRGHEGGPPRPAGRDRRPRALGATTVSATIWAAARGGHPGGRDRRHRWGASRGGRRRERRPARAGAHARACSSAPDRSRSSTRWRRPRSSRSWGSRSSGYGVDRLPFFLASEAPVELEHRVDSPADAAAMLAAALALGTESTLLLCNPVPAADAHGRRGGGRGGARGRAASPTRRAPSARPARRSCSPRWPSSPTGAASRRTSPCSRTTPASAAEVATRAARRRVRLPGRRATSAALWAGAAGPIGFVAVSPRCSRCVRHDVIERQGWVSWPSSMALGGAPGVPMIATFLWLGGCYAVFALGALRPAAISSLAVGGYLVTAAGDLLLAFPTDAPGAPTSWHGTLHLAGVVVATIGTLLVAAGLLRATGGRGCVAAAAPGGRGARRRRPSSASAPGSTPGGRRWSTWWASRCRRRSVPWCLRRHVRAEHRSRARLT